MQEIIARIQYRHIHLSAADVATLFGHGHKFSAPVPLSHKGQSIYAESVTIVGENGMLDGVRVLGPSRDVTQLELSSSDAFAIGIDAPVRISGDLGRAAATVEIRGPHGKVRRKCAIVPARHLHVSDATAKKLKLAHHDVVTLQTHSGTPILHVLVRVHSTFANEFHLSTDEAAIFWLETGDVIHIAPEL